MCYMKPVAMVHDTGLMTRARTPRQGARTVGVRELRQNLSIYLDRVKAGESLSVTEHGHIVAELGPKPAARLTPFERLVADGRATAPTRSLAGLTPPRKTRRPAGADPRSSEAIIAEMRGERR